MSALTPIVDWIGDFPCTHGERGDLDPEHSLACLCGFDDYMLCPEYLDGNHLGNAVIGRDEDGSFYARSTHVEESP